MSIQHRLGCFLALVGLAIPELQAADDYSFANRFVSASGDFNSAANWSKGTAPLSSTFVLIANEGAATLSASVAEQRFGSALVVADRYIGIDQGDGSLEVLPGGIDHGGYHLGSNNQRTGLVRINGGTLQCGEFFVGGTVPVNTIYPVTAGDGHGLLEINSGYIRVYGGTNRQGIPIETSPGLWLANTSASSGRVVLNGGILDAENVHVGNGGAASFLQTAGEFKGRQGFFVGYSPSSFTSTATIAGGTFTLDDNLVVGKAGRGIFDIHAGASVEVGSAFIGAAGNSFANQLNVKGSFTSSRIDVGSSGASASVLTIADHATVSFGNSSNSLDRLSVYSSMVVDGPDALISGAAGKDAVLNFATGSTLEFILPVDASPATINIAGSTLGLASGAALLIDGSDVSLSAGHYEFTLISHSGYSTGLGFGATSMDTVFSGLNPFYSRSVEYRPDSVTLVLDVIPEPSTAALIFPAFLLALCRASLRHHV